MLSFRSIPPVVSAVTLGILALAAYAPAANAQSGNFAVSGGNGTPLVLTLNAPITFTIETASTGATLGFIVEDFDIRKGFDLGARGLITYNSGVSGSIRYSINGGGPLTFTSLQGNYTDGDITPGDAILFQAGSSNSVVAGDTITLLAGTLTSNVALIAAPPTSGTYNVFIIRGNDGARISAISAAPEPSSIGLALVGGLGLMGAVVRRRKQSR